MNYKYTVNNFCDNGLPTKVGLVQQAVYFIAETVLKSTVVARFKLRIGLKVQYSEIGNKTYRQTVTANATTKIALCIELWIFYTCWLLNVKILVFSLQKNLSLYRYFKILYKWRYGD